MTIIEINNLQKNYEKFILKLSNLKIKKNDFIILLGNNGAGKTTLLKAMVDLISLELGEVLFFGKNIRYEENWKKNTGVFLDESFLIPYLTPDEYFHLILKFKMNFPLSSPEHLSKFNIFLGEPSRKKLIRSLSKGNKQKVGIVSTLLANPKLIILDEPHSGLDPTSQTYFNEIICSYHKENNGAIIISSHNLGHLQNLGNRIILLENGRMIKDAPNTPFIREEIHQYFGSIKSNLTNEQE